MTNKSAIVHRVLTVVSCALCLIAALLHLLAFATPYWIESDGDSPFINIGWHQVCFDNCHHPYCPGGDPEIIFDGCYEWTFNDQLRNDYNFQELVNWLFPAWFTAARNIFIINLVLMIVCCIMIIICTCFALADRFTPKSPRKKDIASLALLIIGLFLILTSCLLNIAGVAIFSSNAPRPDYMPLADQNHFGFSYWMEITVCVLLGVCSVTVFLAAVGKTIHFQGPNDPRYSEDMMLGRSITI